MHMTAKRVFALAAMGLILAGGFAQAPAAWAAAPLQKTQAPGWYRLMLGDFEVTALSDGVFSFKVHDLLTNVSPTQLDADLARAFLTEPVDFSVNAFLVNTGSKLVLIDTGTGSSMGPQVGKLLANLQAAGYRPEQVDEIYITHMHGDHIGGLTSNGKANFPNADVHCAQAEGDYWLSDAQMAKAPAEQRDSFKNAIAVFKPYVDSKHYKPFRGNVELLPGIQAIATPGHTPGHTVYKLTSRGETLLLWGDLMHVGAAQFPDPAVAIKFDTDSTSAIAERERIFLDAASHRDLVAGAHIPFPGIGHLRTEAPLARGAGKSAGATKSSVGAGAASSAAVISYSFVPVAYSVPH
jgi:glyoxylase-like metal-dependent hydrolase (beta-lactamase superfamily II)